MQKKKRQKKHQRVNLKNIINRLPIKNHLNESQNALIDFSTTWNKWVQDNLADQIQGLVALNSFKNGILSIRCINASAASHLKHLQVSLKNTFNDAGHHRIIDIKFEIDRKAMTPEHTNELSSGSKNQHIKKEPRKALSNEALNTLGHCEKGVKNEKLSASLRRLHDTLNNLKNNNKSNF